MATAIKTTKPGQRAKEVFLKCKARACSDGTLHLELDTLVENVGTEPIDLLQVLIPYSLIKNNGPSLAITSSSKKCQTKIETWARKQRSQIYKLVYLDNNSFASEDGANWAYTNRVCRHLGLGEDNQSGRTFAIRRYNQNGSADDLEGRLADWKCVDNSLKDFAWGMMALNDYTVVNLVPTDDEQVIPPQSRFWFRIHIIVKATNAGAQPNQGWKSEFQREIHGAPNVLATFEEHVGQFRSNVPKYAKLRPQCAQAVDELKRLFIRNSFASFQDDVRILFYAEHEGVVVDPLHCQANSFYDPHSPNNITAPMAAFASSVYPLPLWKRLWKLSGLEWAYWKFFPKRTVLSQELWKSQTATEKDLFGVKLKWKVAKSRSGSTTFGLVVRVAQLAAAIVSIAKLLKLF